MTFTAVLFDWRGTLVTTLSEAEWVAEALRRLDRDPKRAALAQLGTPAQHTLMVGDRPAKDGAAVECGMTVLLLPPLRSVRERRLHRVLALADAAPGGR